MKRRGAQNSIPQATGLPAAEEIDRIYGLEPVINIGEQTGVGTEGTQCVTVACPYCGESFETQIDMTCGSFEYVEDCQICCQPITLKAEVNAAGDLVSLISLQLNDCA
jgi:hypothetical protein